MRAGVCGITPLGRRALREHTKRKVCAHAHGQHRRVGHDIDRHTAGTLTMTHTQCTAHVSPESLSTSSWPTLQLVYPLPDRPPWVSSCARWSPVGALRQGCSKRDTAHKKKSVHARTPAAHESRTRQQTTETHSHNTSTASHEIQRTWRCCLSNKW